MSLLDFEEKYKPPFKPKHVPGRIRNEEEYLSDINNMDRPLVAEDYSDRPMKP